MQPVGRKCSHEQKNRDGIDRVLMRKKVSTSSSFFYKINFPDMLKLTTVAKKLLIFHLNYFYEF